MNWRFMTQPAFVVALLLLAASAASMNAAIRSFDLYLRKLPIYAENNRALRAIPAETENWKRRGQDRIEPNEIVDQLGTRNYVTRTYVEKSEQGTQPRTVNFHAAYYTNMIDTVPHVPERCFVGAGWSKTEDHGVLEIPLDSSNWVRDDKASQVADGDIYRVRLSNRTSDFPGRRIRLPKSVTPDKGPGLRISEFSFPGHDKMFAGYFFIANGKVLSSAEAVRLEAFDLRDDYAYYAKIQFNSTEVSSAQELAEVAGDLLDDIFGEIMVCLPDWTRVQMGEYPPAEEQPAGTGGNRPQG